MNCLYGYMHNVCLLRFNLSADEMSDHLIHKDSGDRLNMIGRERVNRALIGCENQ